MANELNWCQTIDNVIPDFSTIAKAGHSTYWLPKAILTGQVGSWLDCNTRAAPAGGTPPGLWTHVASCDSVSVSALTDLWLSTFDDTKLVLANAGTAHSWIVIQNATLGLQMLLDLSGGGDAYP